MLRHRNSPYPFLIWSLPVCLVTGKCRVAFPVSQENSSSRHGQWRLLRGWVEQPCGEAGGEAGMNQVEKFRGDHS